MAYVVGASVSWGVYNATNSALCALLFTIFFGIVTAYMFDLE